GDHLFHDLLSASLQWPHPASREKPHSFVSVATVNDINVVAGDSIMKSCTGVLRDKGEERLSPRIVRELKDLVADRFQFVCAYCSNRLRDRFAALFRQRLKVGGIEGHGSKIIIARRSASILIRPAPAGSHRTFVLFALRAIRGN